MIQNYYKQIETIATYNDVVVSGITMNDLIPSLGRTAKYAGQFKVVDGELIYQGSDINMQTWATESGIPVVIVGEPTVTIIPPADTVVLPGTDLVYTIAFSSNAALTTIDLTGKVEVLDDAGVALATQPAISIGTISGTSVDATRQVDITISTNTLANASYKLKIKAGSVTNANNISKTQDTVSLTGFDIDSSAPENPTMSANPSVATSGTVAVTITYSADSLTKEYSLDGTTWNAYTVPVVVTINNTTIYARGKDSAQNESGVATFTVSNIDKDAPTVTYGLNGSSGIQTASTTVTINDVGTSGIDASTIQYVWDTQNTATPSAGWASFTNGQALTKAGVTGTYYLWIKASDNVGNNVVSKTNAFITDNTPPTIAYGTNGGTDAVQVSTTVTASDIGSGINASSLQYKWDTQNVTDPVAGWTIFTNGASLSKTGDGTYYLWVKAVDNAGNLVTEKSNAFTIGDVAIPVSTVQTVNKTFSGATIGFSYDNPVIPAGFVAANTTDANWSNLSTDWDKGLVIQDASGNQFVWVPVNETTVTYTKWCTSGMSYLLTSDDTVPSGFSVTNITTAYKGFYIARYESMFDYNAGSIRVASKKSTNKTITSWSRDNAHTGYLWNFVNYTDAKSYAENMAASYSYDTTKVGTNLITGTEWDTAMTWIQNSGKNVLDSRSWGNHSDSISPANVSGFGNLQISGYSNNWKAKNIYDLAGNTWEWTNETYSSSSLYRGGNYTLGGSNNPAAYRGNLGPSNNDYYLTSRIALYIK